MLTSPKHIIRQVAILVIYMAYKRASDDSSKKFI